MVKRTVRRRARREPCSRGGSDMARTKLDDAEVARRVRALPAWSVVAGKLHREYKFADFVTAFGFMASAALVAEAVNHHPEWLNVYGTVRIDLTTHDAGGLTDNDFQLAARFEELASARGG